MQSSAKWVKKYAEIVEIVVSVNGGNDYARLTYTYAYVVLS